MTLYSSLVTESLTQLDIIQRLKHFNFDFEIYVCGGYLRSLLMKEPRNADLDLFVNCTASQMNSLLDALQPMGRIERGQYGSPRFYPKDSEGHYIDIVPFYNFIVGDKPIVTIDDLLHNFDFTANAIAWDIRTFNLYNPVEGIEDIHHKILRAVKLNFPDKPVSAWVPLSTLSVFWFRLLHYQHVLQFHFDDHTWDWIQANAWRKQDLPLFEKYFFAPSITEEIKQQLGI